MKRKRIIAGGLIIAVLFLTGGCSGKVKTIIGQTNDQETESMEVKGAGTEELRPEYDESGNIIYHFRDIDITLPADWEGRYNVTRSDGAILFWIKSERDGDYAEQVARTSGGYVFGVYLVKEYYSRQIRYVLGETPEGRYELYSPDSNYDWDSWGEDTDSGWYDMNQDVLWIVEHSGKKEKMQKEAVLNDPKDIRELADSQTGKLTGIFVGGIFENDENEMDFWSEDGGIYKFYYGNAERPFIFEIGDYLSVEYQGSNATRITKLTESGEPELEEHYFEGVVESDGDNAIQVKDLEGKLWTIDLDEIQYMPDTGYIRDEAGERIVDEAGNFVSGHFRVGATVRVCYRRSLENPLFVGIELK